MGTVKDWLRRGSHFGIERFGVSILVLVLLTTFLLTRMLTVVLGERRAVMDGTSVYNTEFQTSLSGTKGKVLGVYQNEAKTEFFVFMKFDNLDKISTDAKNFQAFTTGSNLKFGREPWRIQVKPVTTLYVFGSTGYMGVQLSSPRPFPIQIIEMIIRNNYLMTPNRSSAISRVSVQDTFSAYDQFALYLNPGATGAKTVAFLDKPDLNGYDLYYEIFVQDEEQRIKYDLNDTLRKMFFEQRNSREYTRRVMEEHQLQVPELPYEIAGDEIRGYYQGKELTFQDSTWRTPEGQVVPDRQVMFYLEPAYLFADGFDLDWQNFSLEDGYIRQVYDQDQGNFQAFLEDKASHKPQEFKPQGVWYTQSGEIFDMNSSKTGQQNIEALRTSWKTYYQLKRTYQVDLMVKLLKMEEDAQNALSYWSIHQGENAGFIY